MPRANLNPAQIQRATVQRVAQTERETAGMVATVVAVAETLEDGLGTIETALSDVNVALANLDTRISALEP
ncbi:MAG: hypothetical protein ACK40C_09405 [Novosphingobium meiothermophilum]